VEPGFTLLLYSFFIYFLVLQWKTPTFSCGAVKLKSELLTVLQAQFVVELPLSKKLPLFYKGKRAAFLRRFSIHHVLYTFVFVASRGNQLRSLTSCGIIQVVSHGLTKT